MVVIDMNQFLSIGFKPLFLCTALSAVILIGVWGGYFNGVLNGFSPVVSPVLWHGHEMLFGFVGSAIGGFLLTAVASWTRRPAVSGSLLGWIVFCWFAGRLVMAFDVGLPLLFRIAADSAYWFMLTIVIGREVVFSKNTRNYPVVAILSGFLGLSIAFHFYPAESLRGCLALICVLITLIAGRIVPAFTANWLKLTLGPMVSTPVSFNRFDRVVVVLTLPTLFGWSLYPFDFRLGWLLCLVSILHAIRLTRWSGHKTLVEPLVFALHASYGWLPVGFALLGLTAIGCDVPLSAGQHALGIGAIAAMIIAVASRATMGHSGQALKSGRLLTTSLMLIHLVAILRISAILIPDFLSLSIAVWLLTFSIFAYFLIQVIFFPARLRDH